MGKSGLSMSNSEATLRIYGPSELTEIAVIDPRYSEVATGLGELVVSLPVGLYEVRARLGAAVYEKLLALRDDLSLSIDGGDLMFSTPVPLLWTLRTHEYHEGAAYETSVSDPILLGHGAKLLIFARDWSPDETAVGDPMLGLSLHDGSGTKLLDLSPRARRRTEPDVWAAVLVAVNPGPYRLRLIQGDGAVRERMVFATRDWQT